MTWNEMLLETEGYLERYRKALDEIASNDWCNSQESLDKIQEIAQVALDGEPIKVNQKRGLISGYSPNSISKYIILLQSGRYDEALRSMYKDMEKYKTNNGEQL